MTAKTNTLTHSRALYTFNKQLKLVRNGLNYNYTALILAQEILKDFDQDNVRYLQKRIDQAFEKRVCQSEIQIKILDNLWASLSGEVITLCPALC